jgi:sulfonate transport system substrate-binding protein
MKKFVRSALALFAVLAFALGLSGCGGQKADPLQNGGVSVAPRVIRIGFVDDGSNSPTSTLGTAIAKGFIDEGLQKVNAKAEISGFTGAGPAINEAYASGQLDFAIYGDVPAITLKAKGVDTKFILTQYQLNDAGLLVLPNSSFNAVADLKGKKVAVQKGSYMHRTLIKMLEANGLTLNDIDFVNLTATDALPALLAGSIDATLVSGTHTAKSVLNGNTRLLYSCKGHDDWKGSETYTVLKKYADENADVVQAVIDAVLKAKEYELKNPEETKDIYGKSSYGREVFTYLYQNDEFASLLLDDAAVKQYQDVADFLLENQLIGAKLDVKTWADDTFYKKAIK